MPSAEYSCKLYKPIFAYRGPHYLQKWLLKSQADDKADNNSCDWRFKGLIQLLLSLNYCYCKPKILVVEKTRVDCIATYSKGWDATVWPHRLIWTVSVWSRINAYLEVKIWSLPKYENLTTCKKYCGKEEKLLLRSNFSSFPQYFQYISNFKSPITHIFVKCG